MSAAAPAARVLDEAGGVRAMTGVIGIMLFLTVLAAALGLAMLGARAALAREVSGRLTVQLIAGDAATQAGAAARVTAALRATPGVARIAPVDRKHLAALLKPWLGGDANDPDLPMPTLIDVDLSSSAPAAADRVAAAVRAAAPGARVDRHESWMSPVSRFAATLAWLAAGLVVLMAGATAAVVVLAARAGLESHRPTIEVMHMLGSTDRQVSRLFQRRIARDALVGGLVGGAAALGVVALVGARGAAIGSDLVGGVGLSAGDWLLLAALPFAFVALATLAARWSVMAALRRTL